MYSLMFRQFLRSKTCIVGLSLLMVLGVISLLIGKQFLKEQQKIAHDVAEKQADHIARNVEYHSDDLGLLLYYLEFAIINDPSPLAGLSIGQRDLNPSVQSVTIRTLEAQKYDTDLLNPVKLLYGNLDLSFILIYVLPLLIIAFTYNLLSEEEESGTCRMIRVMTRSKIKFLLAKLSVRFVLLFAVVLVLFLLAIGLLHIPVSQPLLAFFSVATLYMLFWFALSFWIISLQRNSNFNALTLLAIWLTFMILVPAVLNNYLTTNHPIPEALTATIQQRDGYHEKWDTNKRETLDAFYAAYPQYEKYGYPPEDGFNWLWYYAMQHLGDVESHDQSVAMQDKILKREQISESWSRFVPTMHAQLELNHLAGTGLTNHMKFLQETSDFHERTRLYFYPHIFDEAQADVVDWESFQPDHMTTTSKIRWWSSLGSLLISVLLFGGLAFLQSKRSL